MEMDRVKTSPVVWWLFLLAVALLCMTWVILNSGPDSALYEYALLGGGMGSGMLVVLGLTTRRWAKGQRAFAKKSRLERSTAERSASRWGCVGTILSLVWLLMGLAAAIYLVAALR